MSWKEIINRQDFSWHVETEKLEKVTPYLLHRCIFNSTEEVYFQFLEYVEKLLEIKSGESVAEFGCGNGANLLHFKEKYSSEIYGIDISQHLIDFCNLFFGKGFFAGSEIPLPSKSVDYFISNSVFQYLDSYDTAEHIISEMSRVARKSVLITDLKNTKFKTAFRENQAQRQGLTLLELDEKYKNTPHLFYDREMFSKTILMPESYPDSEFGSFSAIIILDK